MDGASMTDTTAGVVSSLLSVDELSKNIDIKSTSDWCDNRHEGSRCCGRRGHGKWVEMTSRLGQRDPATR